MKVEQREHNGIVILDLHGPLYTRSHQVQREERKELQDLFQSLILGQSVRVIVTLTKVNYINSVGWGSLIGAYKRLEAAGGELVVVHGGGKFEEVIHLLKLDEVWNTFTNVDQALEYLTGWKKTN
ncbi:MAG: STAS domain-containing protein [Candidatus Krumholzibacteriia bacterium]